jgi:hypothetical protein
MFRRNLRSFCDRIDSEYSDDIRQITTKCIGSELELRLLPGGLCGSPEFTNEILKSGEERIKYTVYGKLGMNLIGRKEVIVINFLM